MAIDMENEAVEKMGNQYECNLCGNHTYKHRHHLTSRLGCDPEKFNVVQCSHCTLHSLFPIPTRSELEQIYANYAEQGDRIRVEQSRMDNIYPKKLALVMKHVSSGNKILDIGAGIGGFTALAKRNGYAVTGVEFEKQQCALAKKLFDVDLICSTFENFFEECTAKYNVVHLHHVLEHLRNPKEVLLKINEILEDNGKVILEVPNQFFVLKTELCTWFGRVPWKKPYNPYHHLYFFSPHTLEAMLRAAGFNIIELNQVYERVGNTAKTKINYALSRMLKMGISSRIEVVAERNDSSVVSAASSN
jgi:2-polyprenyl-3-methyl-5-hydroxy-6-metoxy-1,4-benzoquinol methylase